jgi:glycosyltransferase involved in cell wall biosynthesis
MTVVESMAAGTPVIVFNGGGFKETVVDGVTGVFVNDADEKSLKKAIKRFEEAKWNKLAIQKHTQKFSKERFVREFRKYVKNIY